MAEAVEGVTDPPQPIPTTPVALVEVVMVSEPMVLLVLLALQTLAAEEAAAGKDLALVLVVLVVGHRRNPLQDLMRYDQPHPR